MTNTGSPPSSKAGSGGTEAAGAALPPPPPKGAPPSAVKQAPASSMTNKFMPSTPKMGGLKQVGDDQFSPWTGGQPNVNWKGLKDPNPKMITPGRFRPTSIGSSMKGEYYQKQGLSKKFSSTDDISTFQLEVLEHLTNYGMDSITYLVNPQDPTTTISVVDSHARFNPNNVKGLEASQEQEYDTYDLQNIKDAKEFLRNSLSSDLEKKVSQSCKSDATFIQYWMKLMDRVRPTSIHQFKNKVEELEKRTLQDHAGENVEDLASEYLNDYLELDRAGVYDHKLTYHMLSEFIKGGGATNEEFKGPLRTKRREVAEALLDIRPMTYEDKKSHMLKLELDMESILENAKTEYSTMVNTKQWPAAEHATDSKAMSKNYGGTVKKLSVEEAYLQLNQLIANSNGVKKDFVKTGNCHGCGKPGHWLRDCPEKKGKFQPRNVKGRFNPKKHGSNRGGRFQGGRGREAGRGMNRTGRWPAPKNGESEIRNHEGKKYYWCAKCVRWTISHSTEGHKSKSELEEGNQSGSPRAGMARVDLDFHPSAFRAVVNLENEDEGTDNARLNKSTIGEVKNMSNKGKSK